MTYRHSASTRRALRGFIAVACPPDAAELGIVDDIIDHAELSFQSLPAMIRSGLVTGLTTYELGAAPFFRGKRASQLDIADHNRYFDNWRRSRIPVRSEFIKGLKGLVCMGYYEQPVVKQTIDYTPERWIDKKTRYRLQVYREEIAAHDRALIEPDPLPTRAELDARAAAKRADNVASGALAPRSERERAEADRARRHDATKEAS